MSETPNTLTLLRFNGSEKYRVSEATLVYELDDYSFPDNYYLLKFTVRTESPAMSHSCEDTQEWECAPNIEAILVHEESFPENLTGFKGKIVEPYDENFEQVGHIYYFHHDELRDVSISVLEKNNKRQFRVSISGTCNDVNDFRQAATQVKVDAWFDFSEHNL